MCGNSALGGLYPVGRVDETPSMESRRWIRVVGRVLLAGLAGAAIGLVQCAIVVDGMRSSDRSPGLTGLDASASAALIYAVVTIALLPAACWLLRLRLWFLSGVVAFVAELLVAGYLFAHSHGLDIHGHGRAGLFVAAAIVVMIVVTVLWPQRAINTDEPDRHD